jgi:adenosyl cobinamide kinase/adenosyl cobinamide phosphate guanylyltransferase
MRLIFGGAYQGKLDYAREKYNLKDEDVFFCKPGEEAGPDGPFIDFSAKAACGLEEFVLGCVRSGTEAKDYLEAHRSEWKDMIFVSTDISSGVVPFEKELRAWREMVGRTLMYLGKEAEGVTRIFCGLPQTIK